MTPRETLISEIDALSDEQITALLHLIRTMRPQSIEQPYAEDEDPTIGLFEGDPELAQRTKQILHDEPTCS